eukprot:1367628-Amphidinium_carterae.1
MNTRRAWLPITRLQTDCLSCGDAQLCSFLEPTIEDHRCQENYGGNPKMSVAAWYLVPNLERRRRFRSWRPPPFCMWQDSRRKKGLHLECEQQETRDDYVDSSGVLAIEDQRCQDYYGGNNQNGRDSFVSCLTLKGGNFQDPECVDQEIHARSLKPYGLFVLIDCKFSWKLCKRCNLCARMAKTAAPSSVQTSQQKRWIMTVGLF